MKPGRPRNALKSLGRTSKCFKILGPDSKILGPDSKILENVGSGLPKIAKIYENPKNVIFSSQNRKNCDHWDGKIDSELPLKKNETVLFSSFLVWLAFLNWTCFVSAGPIFFLASSGKIIAICKIRGNRGN